MKTETTDLIKTPRTLSPYMLIQEFLRDEPWKLLVACIMLNRTTAKQVWKILPEFFDRYPTPDKFVINYFDDEAEIKKLIKPLGFQNRRAENLFGMSVDFVTNVPIRPCGDIQRGMFGIGKYGRDSYAMFCEGYLVLDVKDKELKNYVRWAQEQASRGNENSNSGPGRVQRDSQAGARDAFSSHGEGEREEG